MSHTVTMRELLGVVIELNVQKESAVLRPASGPSQETDLIGGHPKLGFLSRNQRVFSWPGLESVAAATGQTKICKKKKHGKLPK